MTYRENTGRFRRRRLRRRRKLKSVDQEAAQQRAQEERPGRAPASPGPAAPGPSAPPAPPAPSSKRFKGIRAYVLTLDRDGVRERLTKLGIDYDGRLSTGKLKKLLLTAAIEAADASADGNGG